MPSSISFVPTLLFHPLKLRHVGAAAMAVTLAGAAYCAGLNVVDHGVRTWHLVILWAAATVLPWYFAYEVNKRALSLEVKPIVKAITILVVLAITLAACGVADWGLARAYGYDRGAPLVVHVYRHLPETVVIAVLTVAASAATVHFVMPPPTSRDADGFPLPVGHIRLVRGAGNYVELEGDGRTFLHRATLTEVETALVPEGFIRISRSIIVPKRRVAEVRMRGGRAFVRLSDGSEHRVGSTFSAGLRRAGFVFLGHAREGSSASA